MLPFAKLLEKFAQHKIDYILVGGLAVDLCGYSRATHDMDILIDVSKDNIQKLLACLKDFGDGSAQELTVQDFTMEEGCIRINEDFPLDIFTTMGGRAYKDLWSYVEFSQTPAGLKIPFLNSEGLIFLKRKIKNKFIRKKWAIH